MSRVKPFVSEYDVQVRRRSWGACQENDNSDSAHSSAVESRWKITFGKKDLSANFFTLDQAMAEMKMWWTRRGLSERRRKAEAVFNRDIKNARRRYEKELKLLDDQLDKIRKLERKK